MHHPGIVSIKRPLPISSGAVSVSATIFKRWTISVSPLKYSRRGRTGSSSPSAGTLLALAIAPAVFRRRGLYFSVGTLAMGVALRLFMVNAPWFGGSGGLFLDGDFPTARVLCLWAFGLMLRMQGAMDSSPPRDCRS